MARLKVMPIFMNVGENNLGRFHTPCVLQLSAQGYHGMNERTKDTVQSHSRLKQTISRKENSLFIFINYICIGIILEIKDLDLNFSH